MKNFRLFVEDVDNKDVEVGNYIIYDKNQYDLYGILIVKANKPYLVLKSAKNKNNEDYFVIKCERGNYIILNRNEHYKKISREEKELYNDIKNFNL